MIQPRTVLIAGPTASGKSALALSVAERCRRVVIINADSMQVYADLRVLTARPTAEEERRVRHELFGHVSGAQAYSAARFVADCRQALAEARARGDLAIIVGGTGLYFKALLEGLSPIPEIPDDVRRYCRAEAERLGAVHLHEALAAKDPVMAARLVPTDTQRITRALEVIEATGQSLSAWQQLPGNPVVEPARTARFVLMPEREAMMASCDTRFDAMLRMGALDEVARLREARLSAELPVMRALGVRPLMAHLDGQMDLTEASTLAKAETRQFAKRQVTWLKRHMISWDLLKTKETERNTDKIISFIDFLWPWPHP